MSAMQSEATEAIWAGRSIWWRLRHNRAVVVGGIVLSVMVVLSTFAPIVTPHDPLEQDTSRRLATPFSTDGSGRVLLGTDGTGRDVLSRILYGGRISLAVSFVGVSVATLVGVTLGLISGYYGHAVDELLMRLVEIQLAFPTILLAIAIVAVIGRSLPSLVGVLALTGWVMQARTVRGTVMSLREKEFVISAKAIGMTNARVLIRHILPNCLPPIIVISTIQMANLVLLEAGLSFFGLGVQPPRPSWGGMLAQGREYMLAGAWWLTVFPGLFLSLTVLGANLLGDGLRDVLDPKLR